MSSEERLLPRPVALGTGTSRTDAKLIRHLVRTLHRRDAGEAQLTEDEAYDVLGLPVGAEPERVDAAHRRLASRAHPDRWRGADLDEQETVRVRFEEVNEAHRVLKAVRKAGLGPSSGSASPGPRRRVAPQPQPDRPASPVVAEPRTAATGGAVTITDGLPDVEDDPHHRVPPGLVAAAVAVAVVVVVLAAIGLSSPSADGSRQREVLGPLAHRLWEAERTGDHGTVWDLAEDDFKARVERAGFVARLDACPRRRPSRYVARMESAGGGLWEVESKDFRGFSGLTYFRQEDTYRFGAVLDDPALLELLAAPVEEARQQRWCQRP